MDRKEESCNVDSKLMDEYLEPCPAKEEALRGLAAHRGSGGSRPIHLSVIDRINQLNESILEKQGIINKHRPKTCLLNINTCPDVRLKGRENLTVEIPQEPKAVTENDMGKLGKEKFEKLELHLIDDGEDSEEEEACNLDEEFLDDTTSIARFIDQIYPKKKDNQNFRSCATKLLAFSKASPMASNSSLSFLKGSFFNGNSIDTTFQMGELRSQNLSHRSGSIQKSIIMSPKVPQKFLDAPQTPSIQQLASPKRDLSQRDTNKNPLKNYFLQAPLVLTQHKIDSPSGLLSGPQRNTAKKSTNDFEFFESPIKSDVKIVEKPKVKLVKKSQHEINPMDSTLIGNELAPGIPKSINLQQSCRSIKRHMRTGSSGNFLQKPANLNKEEKSTTFFLGGPVVSDQKRPATPVKLGRSTIDKSIEVKKVQNEMSFQGNKIFGLANKEKLEDSKENLSFHCRRPLSRQSSKVMDKKEPSFFSSKNPGETMRAKKEEINPKEVDMMLRKSIFNQDFQQLIHWVKVARAGKTSLDMRDQYGFTPLMLCAKLRYTGEFYNQAAEVLVDSGASVKIRDNSSWTAFDESVSKTDVFITGLLFDRLIEERAVRSEKDTSSICAKLRLIPDLKLVIKWDIDSSFIPFVSSLAPSDNLFVWKIGEKVRVDSSLVSFKNLKCKRRKMSTLFKGAPLLPGDYFKQLALVNHTHKTFSLPIVTPHLFSNFCLFLKQEPLDNEERKKILVYYLKGNPVQGAFRVKNISFETKSGFFGNEKCVKIDGLRCKKYEFKVELESTFRLKKETYFSEQWESYEEKLKAFSKDPSATCLPPETPSPQNEPPFTSKPPTLKLSYNNRSLELKEGAPEVKKSTVLVWFTEETQIKFADVLPIIASISTGNKVLTEVMKYFETPELNSLFSKGFITKIQIPLAFSIRANIFFHKLEFIKEELKPNYERHFEVPKTYEHLSRKQAQKTIHRTKKLILLGQALL